MKTHLASECKKYPFMCEDLKQKMSSFQIKNKEGKRERDSSYTL